MPRVPVQLGPSQQVITGDGPNPESIQVENVGGVVVYLSDNQAALDGSVDPVSGVPNEGFTIQPGGFYTDDHNVGPMWARVTAPGAVQVKESRRCASSQA